MTDYLPHILIAALCLLIILSVALYMQIGIARTAADTAYDLRIRLNKAQAAAQAHEFDMPANEDTIISLNPWKLQGLLMTASNQEQPVRPSITSTSVLYAALIAEEFSETCRALHSAIVKHWDTRQMELSIPEDSLLRSLDGLATHNHHTSLVIREALKAVSPFRCRLTREQARELLDGTTDISVVNSGFAQACGFRGDVAYQRVLMSNLSKRNADGIIEKTADGKWIKGPNYREPIFDDLIA